MPRISSITSRKLAGIGLNRNLPREIPIGTFTDPFGSTNTSDFYVEYDPLVTNRVVAAYSRESTTCWVCAGTISNGLITWGTEVQINSGLGSFADTPRIVFDPTTSGTFMVVWSSNILTNGGSVFSRICTLSGTTITIGPNTTADTGACIDTQVARPTLTSNYILTYRKNNFLYSRIATVSGTAITWGSEVVVHDASTLVGEHRLISQGTQFAVFYTDNSTSAARYALGSVSGGLPSWIQSNQPVSSGSGTPSRIKAARAIPLSSNKAILATSWNDSSDERAMIVTFNGSTLSFSSDTVLTSTSTIGNPSPSLKIDPTNGIHAVYMSSGPSVRTQLTTLKLSGSSIVSVDTPIILSGGSLTSISDAIPIPGGNGRLIAWYNDNLSAGGAFRVKQIYGQA